MAATNRFYAIETNAYWTIRPVKSTTVFSETDAQFDCHECGHEELFIGAYRWQDNYGRKQGLNHYRGQCTEVGLNDEVA